MRGQHDPIKAMISKKYIPLNKEKADAFLQSYGYKASLEGNIYFDDNVAAEGQKVKKDSTSKAKFSIAGVNARRL